MKAVIDGELLLSNSVRDQPAPEWPLKCSFRKAGLIGLLIRLLFGFVEDRLDACVVSQHKGTPYCVSVALRKVDGDLVALLPWQPNHHESTVAGSINQEAIEIYGSNEDSAALEDIR